MMKTKLLLPLLVVAAGLVLSSCVGPGGAAPAVASRPRTPPPGRTFLGGRMYESGDNNPNFVRGIRSDSALSRNLQVGHSYRQSDGTWVKYLGDNGSVGGQGMSHYTLHRFEDLGTNSPVRKQASATGQRHPAASGSGYNSGWRATTSGPVAGPVPSGAPYSKKPLKGKVNMNAQPAQPGHQSGGQFFDAPR